MPHGYHWINLVLGIGILLVVYNKWLGYSQRTENDRNIGICIGVLNITLFFMIAYKSSPSVIFLFIGPNLFVLAWLKMWVFKKKEQYRKPALIVAVICMFAGFLPLL